MMVWFFAARRQRSCSSSQSDWGEGFVCQWEGKSPRLKTRDTTTHLSRMSDAAAVQHLNFDIYASLFPKWLESAAAQMVVTVEANHGTEVPAVAREDVLVYQGRDRDEVKDWIPLQGDRARLEL
jgi:hypothetical protein